MHILLTRPLDDSLELIKKFTNLGHKVSHMPVIQIEEIKHQEINFATFKCLILTSANALQFINLSNIDKKILCFCVGASTEKKALNLGFQNVISAQGNVRALEELILQNFKISDGKILYLSGEFITDDIHLNLSKCGYDIKRIVNYKSTPIFTLDENFLSQLKTDIPNIVYLYSHQSALNFLKLIEKYNLDDNWMNTNLMCISEKTSSVLNKIKWKKIFIFSPGEEEFLLYKI